MTTTILKILAAIFMLLDHIWFFFPNTPYFFHWLGRLSAPIFIYCCVLGFINTKSKKKYIIRLYILNLIMGIENYYLDIEFGFIRTLFLISIILFLIDKFRNKDKHAKLYLFLFILWQIIVSTVFTFLVFNTNMSEKELYILITALFSVLSLEGGVLFVFLGIATFIFIDSKKKIFISYAVITLIFVILFNTNLLPVLLLRIHNETLHLICRNTISTLFRATIFSANLNLLYEDPQWMMIFSLIFIFMYNGSKGKGFKYFFYAFYPFHILMLFLLSHS